MSGGVDSSAAAALLREQGHELVGFTMQLWDQNRNINVDEHGDPAFDGAFDRLRPPTDPERTPIVGYDDKLDAFAHTMGARPGVELVGNPATTLHERLWLRPTKRGTPSVITAPTAAM